jgi:hypothetical protein
MTTLAANKPRAFELGDNSHIPVIASDIIYEGAAVGRVTASGHARPLAASDQFAGFSVEKADNSAGSAADINVEVRKKGQISLSVSGAVITDIGQPVYATDDDTYIFLPTAAVFIGFVKRFVSAGVAIVEFNADSFQDPYAGRVYETHSVAKTLDKQDNGKCFFVDTDAQTITLLTFAAATALDIKVVNIASYGLVATAIDPAAGDLISGPDDTGGDGGIMTNTKATAQRGDYVVISTGGDEGYTVVEKKGTWTIA